MIRKNQRNCIIILDFGSQYTQLIVRRVRELGIYCELLAWDTTEEKIRKFNPNGFILSGGPESTTKDKSPRAPNYVFEAGIPVLGICYGMQTMATQLGGRVVASSSREFGYAQLVIRSDSILTHGIQDSFAADGKPLLNVWMSYSDKIISIPSNFFVVASTRNCPFAIIANEEKSFYGIQFHPEVTHTHQGVRILDRFLRKVCRCKELWKPRSIIDEIIVNLRQQIGDEKVILGFSGGVDSLVTAILLNRAIGKKLTCVFIDNGLLRLNEAKQIMSMFSNQFGFRIIHISAEERFFTALKGEKDPEKKRKIISRTFIEIFNEEASKLQAKWFAQGTICPDIIESAASSTGKAHVIKSHHNVSEILNVLKIKILEPLKGLFKDEVRKIGLELGVSYSILFRHPFPGPGLGVRILGEVKKEYCDILRHADNIFIEELRKENLYDNLGQAFAIFLPIRSVGVMGDNRKYDWVISLRAIETIDFMTANWARLPYDFLSHVSNRIINEVRGVSRVLYDISGKPPSTIEWE